MYRVYCDDNLIFDTRIDELKLFKPRVSLELNKIGSFSFTMYPSNPYINSLNKLKSTIIVKQKERIIFRGRILNDVEAFNKSRSFTCESDLAYLLDSIQRPFDFTGSPIELFTFLITEHNKQVEPSKQFKVGNITVTDPNGYIARSDTEYTETLTLINEQLIKSLGGYLNIRYESDGVYIDYLEDFDTLTTQTIEIAKNLTNYSKSQKGEDITTVIIPLGAPVEQETPEGEEPPPQKRLTIESVNGGLDYLENPEAIAKYGRVTRKVIFDDVTEADNLLKKGRDYLSQAINTAVSIELAAVDLANIDESIENFKMGSYVKVKSPIHGIDDMYLVKKLSIDIEKPIQSKLTLGVTYMTFTESTVSTGKQYSGIVNTVTKIESNFDANVANIENLVYSLINQASNEIVMTVGEKFTSKDETSELMSEIETIMTQTKESFEFTFKQFDQTINDLNDSNNAQFSQIEKYIRFEDGNIILGEAGNELTLKIENDKISFIENFKEVAYFSNQKLYITDAEILKSLRIGNFAFIPRANGNLSFKKVV